MEDEPQVIDDREDESDSDDIHVIPMDDYMEHSCSRDCWCQPEEDEEKPLVVIHKRAKDAPH